MSDTRQVVRQLGILRELLASRYGLRTQDLAETYHTTTRTIQRDLCDLREVGFIVEPKRTSDGCLRYYLSGPYEIPVHFTVGEVSALLFMDSVGEALDGTPFRDDLRSLTGRLRQVLSGEQAAFLERAAAAYAPHVRGRKPLDPTGRQVIDTLNHAIMQQRVCRVTYRAVDADRERSYDLEPLRLLYYMEAGGLYLIARVPGQSNPFTLAVERIRHLESGTRRFDMPVDLAAGIDQRLRDTFGIIAGEPFTVRVRFTAQQAPYIRERVWHPSQCIEDQPDGSLILSFCAASEYEIRAWVLQHGARAEVLEPAWLRDQLVAELRASLRAYEKG